MTLMLNHGDEQDEKTMSIPSKAEQRDLSLPPVKPDDLLVVTDLNGQFLYVSQAACDYLGLRDWADLGLDACLSATRQGWVQAVVMPGLLQSGSWCGIIQFSPVGADKEVPVYADVTLLYNSPDQPVPVAVAYSFKSIVEHHMFKGMQFTQDSFTRFLTDNLAEGIYVLDRTGEVIFINPAAEAMLGWPNGSLLGRSIHAAIHHRKSDGSPYPEGECELIEAVRHGKIITHHEDVFIRADGSMFPVLCTSSPLSGDGEIVGAVLTFHDISERKKTEEALRLSTVELEAANFLMNSVTNVQSNFIAGLDQWTLWEQFIQDILILTNSDFGYIGEVYYKESGAPYLVFRGLTNIAWSPETQLLFEGLKTRGLEFHNMENLYGIGLKDGGRTVISNDPAHDPRRGGLPHGHPPLNSFMGLPIYGKNGALIGQVGLANRPGGYTDQLEQYLNPLLVTCSYIIEAYRNLESRTRLDKELTGQFQLTRTIMDNATAALLMIDINGYCTFMNSAAEKMTGYTFEEIRHQPLHNIIHHSRPDGTPYPLAECPIDRALPEKNQVRAHEDIFVRKDGTFFPVLCAAEPIICDGEPVGTVVEVRDITEEKRFRQAIMESEQRFRSLADLAPIMIWVTDAQGRIEYLNKTMFLFTGWNAQQDLDEVWQDSIYPDDRAYVNEILGTALRYRRKLEVEYRLLRADGEYRWLLLNGKPRMTDDGRCIGMIGSSIDITERRQAKEELERLVTERTAQLQATNQELEAFCYSVSHDLRTPLRGIDGFSLAVLEDYADALDVQGQDYLRRVRMETQRMGQLIDDMLKLSRLTRGELKEEKVDLSAIVRDILADLGRRDPQRLVTTEIQDGLLAIGDARLLYVALQNLLENAWKFTSKKEAAHIQFGALTESDHVIYFVRDDGAGFNMAYMDKLFGAFQRLHQVTEFEGTGVGLATVQRIIHRHGGKIWAEGETEHGASFYFTLKTTLPPSDG